MFIVFFEVIFLNKNDRYRLTEMCFQLFKNSEFHAFQACIDTFRAVDGAGWCGSIALANA
jgi:hypothetical protein